MKKFTLTILFISLVLYSQNVFSSDNQHIDINNSRKIAIKYSSAMQDELQRFQKENSSRTYDYSNMNNPSQYKQYDEEQNNSRETKKSKQKKQKTHKHYENEENTNTPKWWRDESTTRWGLFD